MVNLNNGSVYDSKCDLIILPCNDLGGVTSWVRREIVNHSLPPIKSVGAGEVWYADITSGYPNASVVGYAASVSTSLGKSSKEIIESISQSVKRYCEHNSISIVNMPLLGTGAGHLSAIEVFDIITSVFENEKNIIVNVCAVNKDSYAILSKNYVKNPSRIVKNPRVFLSYTAADEGNGKWVKNLANRLRASGVDARIDIYHLQPGVDLPQWMTNELIMADKVLLICDKYYAEKADVRKGGVGWETMIIQGDMLTHQNQNKYAALIRDKDIDRSIPIYMKSKFSIVWPETGNDEEAFKRLLIYLFDRSEVPPIKEIPAWINDLEPIQQ